MFNSAKKNKQSLEGFVVLYAMLVAGMLLAVGLAIFNITYKETLFASIARDSNLALYAADSGIECALYWDWNYYPTDTNTADLFPTGSIFATSTYSSKAPSPINCSGTDITTKLNSVQILTDSNNPLNVTAISSFMLPLSNNTSAYVTVTKQTTVTNEVTKQTTTINSDGYNTPDNTSTAPNRIQRTLQSIY